MCFFVYLACYTARNILSVVSPQMERDGINKTVVGLMSAVSFFSYGFGQLINGLLGDRIKLKYMLLTGLLLSALSCALFGIIRDVTLCTLLWCVCGFGNSFFYAPLVKTVAEHTEGRHAEICMTALNAASILGAVVAGVIGGAVGSWRTAFYVTAIILCASLVLEVIINTVLDKIYKKEEQTEQGENSFADMKGFKSGVLSVAELMPIKAFFKQFLSAGGIVVILLMVIQGTAKNAITFWVPTYISDRLNFDPHTAALITAVMMAVTTFNQVISIFLYHLFKGKFARVVGFSFAVALVCFVLLIFVKSTILNLILLIVAVCAYNWAGNIIWTFYCRSFRSTGRVSFLVGFLDCSGYIAAGLANLVFSNAVDSIGCL